MQTQTIHLAGEAYVIVPKAEWERLAKADSLPPLPAPDKDGNVPAVDYARASLARKIIADRLAAGLTQQQLAEAAGVRVETLCRIERGKNTPSVPTIDKIDQALAAAEKKLAKKIGLTAKRSGR